VNFSGEIDPVKVFPFSQEMIDSWDQNFYSKPFFHRPKSVEQWVKEQ